MRNRNPCPEFLYLRVLATRVGRVLECLRSIYLESLEHFNCPSIQDDRPWVLILCAYHMSQWARCIKAHGLMLT